MTPAEAEQTAPHPMQELAQMVNITYPPDPVHHKRSRRPVPCDAYGRPIPQALSKHLLDDAAFDAHLAAHYAAEDRTGLTEMFAALEREAV